MALCDCATSFSNHANEWLSKCQVENCHDSCCGKTLRVQVLPPFALGRLFDGIRPIWRFEKSVSR